MDEIQGMQNGERYHHRHVNETQSQEAVHAAENFEDGCKNLIG
jgi:hypothetical protein